MIDLEALQIANAWVADAQAKREIKQPWQRNVLRMAVALLAEHDRQDRERCANCSYYLPRASGYPMCVSWGNDTDESDFCSRWKPVPKGVEP